MIFDKTGHVANELYVTGLSWSPVYLLNVKPPVLFEAGFNCAGMLYEEDIKAVLKGSQPEILFLTHVHWDHCGATSYLRGSFPNLKVAASERAAKIIERPNAQKLMVALSKEVIPHVSAMNGIDKTKLLDRPFEPFHIDMILGEGQVLELDKNLTLHVLATPGHTRDHLSYYIPEKKILIATEAPGCMDRTGNIATEFLIDYDIYVASLKRLATLPVEVLCQGHHYVFVGKKEVENFFARSLMEAERFKTRVYELLRAEKGSIERVMSRIKAEQYDPNPGPKQEKKAYLLNLKTRITHFAERFYDNNN